MSNVFKDVNDSKSYEEAFQFSRTCMCICVFCKVSWPQIQRKYHLQRYCRLSGHEAISMEAAPCHGEIQTEGQARSMPNLNEACGDSRYIVRCQ